MLAIRSTEAVSLDSSASSSFRFLPIWRPASLDELAKASVDGLAKLLRWQTGICVNFRSDVRVGWME